MQQPSNNISIVKLGWPVEGKYHEILFYSELNLNDVTTDPLIVRPLSGSPKCMVMSSVCLRPRHSYYIENNGGGEMALFLWVTPAEPKYTVL